MKRFFLLLSKYNHALSPANPDQLGLVTANVVEIATAASIAFPIIQNVISNLCCNWIHCGNSTFEPQTWWVGRLFK